MTCHISQNLKNKIAKGEYVDLEQLVPKDKYGRFIDTREESRVELVSKEGHTYFKSMKESQINGLRKWEQAFRVYAAIYTENNPKRSVEIWQYMHVINVAASSFQWENVANYDLTFRQLMSYKPHRSWAKIYNQGWNLAMRDPLSRNNTANQQNNSNHRASQGNGRRDWRDDCCWKYNRNRCHKLECRYDHRCSYCGRWNHGFYNCHKRLRKEGRSSGETSSSHKPHKRHRSRSPQK